MRGSDRFGSALRMLQDQAGAAERLRALAAVLWEGMMVQAQGVVALAASVSAPTSCGGTGDRLLVPRRHYFLGATLDVAVVVDERGFVIARVYDSWSERAPSCLGGDPPALLGTVAHALWPLQAGALVLLCGRAQRLALRCCPAGFEACWLVQTGTGLGTVL
jgi:hypothetical protein